MPALLFLRASGRNPASLLPVVWEPALVGPQDSASDAPVVVLGIGNLLLADDGIGPLAAQELQRLGPWPGVDVFDIGTPGLELTTFLTFAQTIILIDAVEADGVPGAIRRYGRDKVIQLSATPRMSPHEVALAEAILTAELVRGARLDVILVGVVVKTTALGAPMSTEVKAALPEVIETTLHLLAERGVSPPTNKSNAYLVESGRDDDTYATHHSGTTDPSPGQST